MLGTINIPLDRDDLVFLSRRVEGGGGFQGLLRDLQAARVGGMLCLSESLARRVIDYSESYGDGGFQQRLRGLVAKMPPLPALEQQTGLFG